MSLLKPSVALVGLSASAKEVCGTTKPPVTSDALLTKEKHRRAGNQTQLTEVIKLLPQVHLSGGSFIYRLNPWYWFRWLFEVNHKSFRSYQTIFDHFPTTLDIFRQQDMSQSDFHTILSPGNRRYRRRIKTPLKSSQPLKNLPERPEMVFSLSLFLCFVVLPLPTFFAIKLFDDKETLWL